MIHKQTQVQKVSLWGVGLTALETVASPTACCDLHSLRIRQLEQQTSTSVYKISAVKHCVICQLSKRVLFGPLVCICGLSDVLFVKQDRVMVEFSPLSQQLTSHINQLLTAAYTKYEVWQSRRKSSALR